MALFTVEAVVAALIVLADKVVRTPVGARLGHVVVLVRRPSEVLPGVSIDAKRLNVRGEVEGAVHSLVVKHEEVGVVHIVVNEINLHFVFIMGKRTEGTVFTFRALVEVGCTELLLVLVISVKLLDPVMRKRASLSS